MTLFAFLDIETPGLTPEPGHILEIAWSITDDQFKRVYATRSFLVDHEPHEWAGIYATLRVTDVVLNMHTESGLLADLNTRPLRSMAEIARAFRDDVELATDGLDPDMLPIHLAGPSIHFDKSWLAVDPDFGLFFDNDFYGFGIHHRMLDLSSIKLMYGVLGWDIPEQPENPRPHRALSDVRESLIFARSIRNQLDGLRWAPNLRNRAAEEVSG